MDIRGKDDQLRESCGYQREVLRSKTNTVYSCTFLVFSGSLVRSWVLKNTVQPSVRRFVCLSLSRVHRVEQVARLKTCFLSCFLFCWTPKRKRFQSSAALMGGSVRSCCCMFTLVHTGGGKYWGNQTLEHRNMPETDKIIKMRSWTPTKIKKKRSRGNLGPPLIMTKR